MEKKMKAVLMVAAMLIMAGSSAAFAEGSDAGNAVVNGLTSIVKMPMTMLHKASDSLDNGSRSAGGSEDVMVSDVYNLDAETTG